MRKLNLLSSLLLMLTAFLNLYVFIDTLRQSTGEMIKNAEGGLEMVNGSVLDSPLFFPTIAVGIFLVIAAALALVTIITQKPLFLYIQIAMAVVLAAIFAVAVMNDGYYLGYFMSVRFGFNGIVKTADDIKRIMWVLYLGMPLASAAVSTASAITQAVQSKKVKNENTEKTKEAE